MNSKIWYIFILFFIFNNITIAQYQSRGNVVEKIDIQFLSLNNIDIEKAIRIVIKRIENQNQVFKNGFGFLYISDIEIANTIRPFRLEKWDSIKNDTILKVNINIGSYILLEKFEVDGLMSDSYPPFYTFVDGRLILLYDSIFHAYAGQSKNLFTEKSKKILREAMLTSFKLALNEDFEFTDLLGQKRKFSKEQRLKMTQTEIFKKANFVLDVPPQKVYVLRDGRLIY